MHAPIHLAISWLVGHRLPERRDRRLVTWAGVVPDLDGVSLLFGVEAYSKYHHTVSHGLIAAVVVAGTFGFLSGDRWKTMLLSLAAFHIHLICDLVGSGAQGEPWPIVYLWPFSSRDIFFTHGWDLASPQNAVVWLVCIALTIRIALTRGRTFAEAFLPAKADAAVVATLRKIAKRFRPQEAPAG